MKFSAMITKRCSNLDYVLLVALKELEISEELVKKANSTHCSALRCKNQKKKQTKTSNFEDLSTKF